MDLRLTSPSVTFSCRRTNSPPAMTTKISTCIAAPVKAMQQPVQHRKVRLQKCMRCESSSRPDTGGTSEPSGTSDPSRKADVLPSTSTPKNKDSGNGQQTLTQYLIWIFALLTVVGSFYTATSVLSTGLSMWLQDKVTFTRKDFVPYSERRRMEAELAQRAALEAAENGGAAPEQDSASDTLLDLLPAPSVR